MSTMARVTRASASGDASDGRRDADSTGGTSAAGDAPRRGDDDSGDRAAAGDVPAYGLCDSVAAGASLDDDAPSSGGAPPSTSSSAASRALDECRTQLAASLETSRLQARALAGYREQLRDAQLQLARSSTNAAARFEIYVSKDTFKFHASHFVAYPGFRERLHGHSYRAAVKLVGNHQIGRDGYVLDFGCVKSVAKDVCKEMNEYFLVPMLSEVLTIDVDDDEEDDARAGGKICGDCADDDAGTSAPKKGAKRKRAAHPGSVSIACEDGSRFVFPRQDCLLLPIMHSTAEELGVYLYGKILERIDATYLRQRGVEAMEVTVSEAVGQDAVFRRAIPAPGEGGFDVMSYISEADIPVMPCATETEAAGRKVRR
ncbi:hypothetical protein ACHAWF_006415 [Thalassiosira exigua]